MALVLLTSLAHAFAQVTIESELALTFEKGRVHASIDGSLREMKVSQALGMLATAPLGTFRGVVLYLHGCDGINDLSVKTGDLLAMQGFVVFMPDSFARISKPVSCQPSLYLGGLHREVLSWRHSEADYAIKRLKALPTLDVSNLILMGLSEGAIATATYVGEPITARIIEGWSCHSGWPEYSGLRAPPDEPTLAISAENDPWFQKPELRGECGEYIVTPSALRRSLVFRAPHPAASAHDLMWNVDARRQIFDFLDAVTRRSP